MSRSRIVKDDAEDLLTEEVSQAIGTFGAACSLLGFGKGRGRRIVVSLGVAGATMGVHFLRQLNIASMIQGEVLVARASCQPGVLLGFAVRLGCRLARDKGHDERRL